MLKLLLIFLVLLGTVLGKGGKGHDQHRGEGKGHIKARGKGHHKHAHWDGSLGHMHSGLPAPPPQEGPLHFSNGPKCGDDPLFTLKVMTETCYSAGLRCGDRELGVLCNGQTWDGCHELIETEAAKQVVHGKPGDLSDDIPDDPIERCKPEVSFMISDGEMQFFFKSPDCEGPHLPYNGCGFQMFRLNGANQINATQLVELSVRKEPESTTRAKN